MSFKVYHTTHGFKDGGEPAQFAYNGTFFDSDYLPTIGYSQGAELDDPRRRREEKLGALEEMVPRGEPLHERTSLFTTYSDWITYHTVVSTSSDQMAISPGYLKKTWQKDGRNYFEYDMGPTHILDFVAWVSAKYAVKKEVYPGSQRPHQSRGLLRPRAHLRYRRNARKLAQTA